MSGEAVDTMVRVDGKVFHCRCTANVFHVDPETGYYVCNACGTEYEGTPE